MPSQPDSQENVTKNVTIKANQKVNAKILFCSEDPDPGLNHPEEGLSGLVRHHNLIPKKM